ncbi:MAG: hypothetical protein M5U26_08430 [Planctomycetota bacterium]|nr:hypothetical protein [Planctomycetota bacterium]
MNFFGPLHFVVCLFALPTAWLLAVLLGAPMPSAREMLADAYGGRGDFHFLGLVFMYCLGGFTLCTLLLLWLLLEVCKLVPPVFIQ